MSKTIVSEIINEWDPIGLFPYAPKDEYEVEIFQIQQVLNITTDKQILANKIMEIFIKRFGNDVFTNSYDDCLEVAEEIINSINY